jgi:hypothetical protein
MLVVVYDVSGQAIGPVLKGQTVRIALLDPWKWDRCNLPKHRSKITKILCRTQQTKDLIYTTEEA